MSNLSKLRRDQMLDFLNKLRDNYSDDESLITINEIESELLKKKYGLVWEEHEERVDLEMKTKIPVFREVLEKEIKQSSQNDYNFLLEGDNLHSLKLLEKTHKESIDVIYIDPPYNTGGIDFRYDDTIIGKDDGFRHSKWLSFMNARLKIAKKLLTEDGVIFISIDESEMSHLKLLCDSIFGEENHVETIIWKNKYGAGAKTVGFITVHEYILCYSRNPVRDITSELSDEDKKKYNKKDEKFETRGGYVTQPLMTTSLGDRPNLMYDIEYNGVTISPKKQWVWKQDRLEEAIANNEVEFNLQKDGSYSVRAKKYLMDEEGNCRRGKPLSIMNGPFTQEGTQEIKDLFKSDKAFKFAKPSALIKYLISLEINGKSNKNITVLDFFAGSGTTAHAVLELNKLGGNRKFILCTNNESNICEDVTYKRIEQVINGYETENGDKVDGFSANLKYYQTDFIDKTSSDAESNVSSLLLEHMKEMVQLQHGVAIDGNNYVLILTDEDADHYENNPELLKDCKEIYISSRVLLTKSQKELLDKFSKKSIPDYYFENELREVGEL